MEIESKQQILERRKEIEQELLDFLKETNSDFALDHIKDIIYNEEGQDDLTDVIAMFDTGQGASELENIMDTINDAWNYFPHKIIGGLSPAEKLLEYQQKINK
jgi:Ran GTPase-activating protein (RanGAP) involved in mRNA processing and transport